MRQRFSFDILVLLLMCPAMLLAQDAAIATKLSQLKQKDDLSEWLYTRMEYANVHPKELPFLMASQKQAWRQPKNNDEQLAWLTLLSSQGYNQLQTGDILASINCYE